MANEIKYQNRLQKLSAMLKDGKADQVADSFVKDLWAGNGDALEQAKNMFDYKGKSLLLFLPRYANKTVSDLANLIKNSTTEKHEEKLYYWGSDESPIKFLKNKKPKIALNQLIEIINAPGTIEDNDSTNGDDSATYCKALADYLESKRELIEEQKVDLVPAILASVAHYAMNASEEKPVLNYSQVSEYDKAIRPLVYGLIKTNKFTSDGKQHEFKDNASLRNVQRMIYQCEKSDDNTKLNTYFHNLALYGLVKDVDKNKASEWNCTLDKNETGFLTLKDDGIVVRPLGSNDELFNKFAEVYTAAYKKVFGKDVSKERSSFANTDSQSKLLNVITEVATQLSSENLSEEDANAIAIALVRPIAGVTTQQSTATLGKIQQQLNVAKAQLKIARNQNNDNTRKLRLIANETSKQSPSVGKIRWISTGYNKAGLPLITEKEREKVLDYILKTKKPTISGLGEIFGQQSLYKSHDKSNGVIEDRKAEGYFAKTNLVEYIKLPIEETALTAKKLLMMARQYVEHGEVKNLESTKTLKERQENRQARALLNVQNQKNEQAAARQRQKELHIAEMNELRPIFDYVNVYSEQTTHKINNEPYDETSMETADINLRDLIEKRAYPEYEQYANAQKTAESEFERALTIVAGDNADLKKKISQDLNAKGTTNTRARLIKTRANGSEVSTADKPATIDDIKHLISTHKDLKKAAKELKESKKARDEFLSNIDVDAIVSNIGETVKSSVEDVENLKIKLNKCQANLARANRVFEANDDITLASDDATENADELQKMKATILETKSSLTKQIEEISGDIQNKQLALKKVKFAKEILRFIDNSIQLTPQSLTVNPIAEDETQSSLDDETLFDEVKPSTTDESQTNPDVEQVAAQFDETDSLLIDLVEIVESVMENDENYYQGIEICGGKNSESLNSFLDAKIRDRDTIDFIDIRETYNVTLTKNDFATLNKAFNERKQLFKEFDELSKKFVAQKINGTILKSLIQNIQSNKKTNKEINLDELRKIIENPIENS